MSGSDGNDIRNGGGSSVDRRTLVKAGLGALAAPAVLRIIPANAQSKTIKVGHVSPKPARLPALARPTASSSIR